MKIIFEDQSLLVIEKEPDLVVTSTQTQTEETLEDILKEDYRIKAERSGIVHRLDKDTSGLMVIAKDNLSLKSLQSQFKSRLVKKEYLVLVHGFVKEAGRIEGAILRNPSNRKKFTVAGDGVGKDAVTQYLPLKSLEMSKERISQIFFGFNKIQIRKIYSLKYPQFTLLTCIPLTGRTHQIRVHLKYISYPIVGDSKYGGRKISRLDGRWCPRQFLHAAKLEFNHPATGERMVFASNLPEDLKQALSLLDGIN